MQRAGTIGDIRVHVSRQQARRSGLRRGLASPRSTGRVAPRPVGPAVSLVLIAPGKPWPIPECALVDRRAGWRACIAGSGVPVGRSDVSDGLRRVAWSGSTAHRCRFPESGQRRQGLRAEMVSFARTAFHASMSPRQRLLQRSKVTVESFCSSKFWTSTI